MKKKEDLLRVLQELDIRYKSCSHEPINNVQDAEKYGQKIEGAHYKNLFLQDTAKRVYLVVVLDSKKVDLKKLAQQINSKRLSFASPACLEATLGIMPGCVTPLALINDPEKKVKVVIDRDILRENQVHFHPLVNIETLTITPDDFMKFIAFCGQDKVFFTI
ncbi:MAG: prolyl-tRNA synthetase associated domain-containing protein [Alphaproteobacteria bacterium]|nr:prolyl-tRNA synthetase associated domain-containing protein [Alphaproteobacteria bacterium]